MALTQTAAPTVEPLTLAEAKSHLRVTIADDDVLITALIVAARTYAEQFTHRAFVTQTWEWRLDAFRWTFLDVPLPKLQSVTSIQYLDTAGVLQTLAASQYLVDPHTTPGRIAPVFGSTWPSTHPVFNAVTITFIAGFGDAAAVEDPIKHALRLIIGELYERRETAIVGAPIVEVPLSAKALLMPYVIHGFG